MGGLGRLGLAALVLATMAGAAVSLKLTQHAESARATRSATDLGAALEFLRVENAAWQWAHANQAELATAQEVPVNALALASVAGETGSVTAPWRVFVGPVTLPGTGVDGKPNRGWSVTTLCDAECLSVLKERGASGQSLLTDVIGQTVNAAVVGWTGADGDVRPPQSPAAAQPLPTSATAILAGASVPAIDEIINDPTSVSKTYDAIIGQAIEGCMTAAFPQPSCAHGECHFYHPGQVPVDQNGTPIAGVGVDQAGHPECPGSDPVNGAMINPACPAGYAGTGLFFDRVEQWHDTEQSPGTLNYQYGVWKLRYEDCSVQYIVDQSVSCGPGYIGSITIEQRNTHYLSPAEPSGVDALGSWYQISNTCALPPGEVINTNTGQTCNTGAYWGAVYVLTSQLDGENGYGGETLVGYVWTGNYSDWSWYHNMTNAGPFINNACPPTGPSPDGICDVTYGSWQPTYCYGGAYPGGYANLSGGGNGPSSFGAVRNADGSISVMDATNAMLSGGFIQGTIENSAAQSRMDAQNQTQGGGGEAAPGCGCSANGGTETGSTSGPDGGLGPH